MKTPKPLAYAIATSFFAFASIGAVSASSGSAGSFADLLSLSGPSATFTGGPGGTLYVPSPPGTAGIPVNFFLDATHQTNAIFTLSPVVGTSTAVPVFGTFQETTTGGTFSIANGSTTYLSGTYTSGILGVANGGTTVSFKSGGANSVVYTGGTFLAPAGLSAGDIGSFNFSFSGANTGAGSGVSVGAYINGFVSRGASGTFSADHTSVPEPESLLPLIVGGMLLFGFGLRRRNVPAETAA